MKYIVVGSSGPLVLSDYGDGPRAGVLTYSGRKATGFNSYSDAYNAIDRTRVYSERRNLNWPTDRKIVRIVPKDL